MDTHDRPVHPSVVAVVGSPRPHGNTVTVVREALSSLRARNASDELVMLSEYRIEPCQGHDDCGSLPLCPLNDDALPLFEKVYAADVLILASPVYYENVSGQMKVFLDRNLWWYTRERWLRPVVFGLVAVTCETGLEDAVGAFRRFVGLSTREQIPVEVLTGYACELGDAARNEELMLAARAFGDRLAAYLRE